MKLQLDYVVKLERLISSNSESHNREIDSLKNHNSKLMADVAKHQKAVTTLQQVWPTDSALLQKPFDLLFCKYELGSTLTRAAREILRGFSSTVVLELVYYVEALALLQVELVWNIPKSCHFL